MEIKEMKEQLNELVILLRQSEAQRKEIVKEQKLREQAVAIALATSALVRLSAQYFIDVAHDNHTLSHDIHDVWDNFL